MPNTARIKHCYGVIAWALRTAANNNSESEGVLMVITAYGVIVFHLVVWVGVQTMKSSKAAKRKYGENMLGFAYPAIPTRHEVP